MERVWRCIFQVYRQILEDLGNTVTVKHTGASSAQKRGEPADRTVLAAHADKAKKVLDKWRADGEVQCHFCAQGHTASDCHTLPEDYPADFPIYEDGEESEEEESEEDSSEEEESEEDSSDDESADESEDESGDEDDGGRAKGSPWDGEGYNSEDDEDDDVDMGV